MTIDPESQAFIAWVDELLADPQVYHEFLLECRRQFQNFISRDPVEIRQRLALKLGTGAIEHGAPVYEDAQIAPELEAEFIDILGWSLVRQWQAVRLTRKRK